MAPQRGQRSASSSNTRWSNDGQRLRRDAPHAGTSRGGSLSSAPDSPWLACAGPTCPPLVVARPSESPAAAFIGPGRSAEVHAAAAGSSVEALAVCSTAGTIQSRWLAPRSENPVVSHLVGAGWRDQGGKPLEQFVTLHENVGRAVAPLRLELVAEATVGQGLEAFEGNRGTQDTASETCQSSSIPRGDASRPTASCSASPAGARRSSPSSPISS